MVAAPCGYDVGLRDRRRQPSSGPESVPHELLAVSSNCLSQDRKPDGVRAVPNAPRAGVILSPVECMKTALHLSPVSRIVTGPFQSWVDRITRRWLQTGPVVVRLEFILCPAMRSLVGNRRLLPAAAAAILCGGSGSAKFCALRFPSRRWWSAEAPTSNDQSQCRRCVPFYPSRRPVGELYRSYPGVFRL